MPVATLELLGRGGVIVTANARTARALHLRYAEHQQAEGATAWPTPQILDLHAWLAEQWKTLLLTGTEDRLQLNELQELALWQRIMKPALAGRTLIEPAHMAKLAQDAYSLLADYNALGRLNDAMWMAEPSAEPEVFRKWARGFQEECARQRCLPRCELTGAVTYALAWGAVSSPAEIGWLGFDRPTPAEEALKTALEARGAKQKVLGWDIESKPPRLYAAPSERDESAACARWVLSRQAAEPGTRIGILMPDLARDRSQLERDLYRLLSPDRFEITAGAAPPLPFEFSLGQPLADVPLVHAALLLLRWLDHALTQQEISWLLLSSSLGASQGDAAREAMAHLDAKLRNARCAPPEMALESFLRRPQSTAHAVTLLHHDLSSMMKQHRQLSRRSSAGEWVRRITVLLRLARWGEGCDTSSLLFQAREAWDRLLDNVASLDFANGTYSFKEFLTTLDRAAQDAIFAPESHGAPVQVMGAYAAAGQSFDAVWFLGATDTAWPSSGRPNPLLPLALQRDLGIPHSSAVDNTVLAHRAMERIANSCGEVIYSYAQMSDEALQRPSPLASSFAPADRPIAREEPQAMTLDTVLDEDWVPVMRTGVAPGGQSALKRQADCPFQAFVFHRLRTRELSIAGRGLSPGERGTLIHRVMQYIWSQDIGGHIHLKDHADLLKAISTGALRPLVAEHAAAAIRWMNADHGDPWQRAYLKAEAERASDLVMDWLTLESARQPFQVAAVEEEIHIIVGDLPLKVRADRIDRIPGGDLLIDYKTGEVSTASWEGPRPEQPQLPLYAAFGAKKLVGAVFAQLRRPTLGFKGRVEDARANLSEALGANDPLVTVPYTDQLVEEWRGTLLSLSERFVRGEAQVDPHVYPKSCQYCPLPGLCRVAENRGSAPLPDSTDPEDAE